MKESNSNIVSITTLWVSILLLQCQVVKTDDFKTFLFGSQGEIKSHLYPQKYHKGYYHVWHIKAPRGYRIRLQFRDFDVGTAASNCRQGGDNLEVQTNRDSYIFLCGQKLPAIIESKRRRMSIYMNPAHNSVQSTRGRFWAHYEIFNSYHHQNQPKLTRPERIPTKKPHNPTQGNTNASVLTNKQRIFLLGSMVLCIIVLTCVSAYFGCKRQCHLSYQGPAVSNNTDLEIQDEILELGFGDPPPSYEEVTRQSLPDVSITQQPSGGNDNEGMDSTGLPSYREALKLSQQSLNRNL